VGPPARPTPTDAGAAGLVLASIIAKETGRADERKPGGRGVHNRLRQKMKLQSDPTIIYGAGRRQAPVAADHSQRDRASDALQHLRDRGLPPGPIANPLAALEAAHISSRDARAHFVVADGNGGHAFRPRTLEQAPAQRRAPAPDGADHKDKAPPDTTTAPPRHGRERLTRRRPRLRRPLRRQPASGSPPPHVPQPPSPDAGGARQ